MRRASSLFFDEVVLLITRSWHKLLIAILTVLPKNLMSRVAGLLTSIPYPGPIAALNAKIFGMIFGVNFDEVKAPLSTFKSINQFFVRELKDGVRPIAEEADAFASPCDAAWGQCGDVENNTILQVKGRPYSLSDLLGEDTSHFEGGTFATLYLSPKDYHRFHSPCAATIRRSRYIPGKLWPVNAAGVNEVDGLFAKNERVVSFFEVEGGEIAIVPVGATMVGKIIIKYDERLTSNVGGKNVIEAEYETPIDLDKGEEWGRFKFGSTLVLAATKGVLDLDVQSAGTPVQLGKRIGTLHV
ncbi:MAG: phosphatidylserine decarboxylase [Deltaproteobacteria bacterium]|nr:phosphatidylserine decarboxylase [Deltaproteobacteria bacterium]